MRQCSNLKPDSNMRGCSVLAASRLVAPRHHRVVAFLAQLGLNLSAPDFNFGTFTDIGLLSARGFRPPARGYPCGSWIAAGGSAGSPRRRPEAPPEAGAA